MKNNIAAIFFGIFVSIVLLIIIELGALVILGFSGKNEQATRVPHDQEVFQSIDPLIGYCHNTAWLKEKFESIDNVEIVPGFIKYKSNIKTEAEPYKIVALGGSTTDGSLYGFSWPESLQEIFNREGYHVEVYNGGVGGYSSNQELLKLLRDVSNLQPDMVICLNGINDIAFRYVFKEKHPLTHTYMGKVIKNMIIASESNSIPFLPNTFKLVKYFQSKALKNSTSDKLLHYGYPSELNPSENWAKNVAMMKGITKTFGAEYLCFLQPTIGIGEYALNKEEEEWYAAPYTGDTQKEYTENLDAFYNGAIDFCQETDFCLDLVNVFENEENVYRNLRHQNLKGVQVLADNIFEEIKNRKYIENNFYVTKK